MNKLKVMFKENWKSIMFSYSLFAINSILMVMYPKVLGNAIDHLMAKDYSYIWYLVSTFVAIMFFGWIETTSCQLEELAQKYFLTTLAENLNNINYFCQFLVYWERIEQSMREESWCRC